MLQSRLALLSSVVFCTSGLLAQDGTPAFSDQAAAAGVQFQHQNGSGFTQSNYTAGGTVGDFNRDGQTDLFAISGGGPGRDKLFMNNGDGTFTDKALAWELLAIHNGKGATTGDYNDDGWLDIYATSAGPLFAVAPGHHKLYRNNGNDSFTNVASAAGVNSSNPNTQGGFGSAFGDYDLDGDLDLFVAGFSSSSANTASRIFRNDGDGTFSDVTTAINFWGQTNFGVAAFAPRFADMNGDRYPELLLVGDFGSSRYFRNNANGTFSDVTNAWWAGQDENGMGGTLGDFNNDGLFDWYVTSIHWLSQSWTGNKLYLNTPSNILNEVALAAGVEDGGYGWGTVAVDFDNDGNLDIAETNGDNGTHLFVNEQSYLWMNNGDGTFTESALTNGLSHFDAGRGMTNFDYDADGDQDIVIFANFANLTLWRNDLSGTEINWLRVFLDTTANDELAPDGYGSVISATTAGMTRWRHMYGGDNFQSCSELSGHFGLGAATIVDELRVEWSNGAVTVLNNVAVNQTITVSAPEDDNWTRVGLGKGGLNGVPQLRGVGSLAGGTTVEVTLTSGKPGSSAFFVMSAASLQAPFKGGTLVPFPDIILDFPTNGSGVSAPATTWPLGVPAGAKLWFQVWQQDPTGYSGWISSNGLVGTTP
jgi:hypothetical protein